MDGVYCQCTHSNFEVSTSNSPSLFRKDLWPESRLVGVAWKRGVWSGAVTSPCYLLLCFILLRFRHIILGSLSCRYSCSLHSSRSFSVLTTRLCPIFCCCCLRFNRSELQSWVFNTYQLFLRCLRPRTLQPEGSLSPSPLTTLLPPR